MSDHGSMEERRHESPRGVDAVSDKVRVLCFDIFGTTVDWWTGISRQVGDTFRDQAVDVDPAAFTNEWRGRYLPALEQMRAHARAWVSLDTLHRESLDDLLGHHPAAERLDKQARTSLVNAWHSLPAWPDSREGIARLRERYTVVALSNAGFAQMVRLTKRAGLDFDAIVSAELAHTYKPDPCVYLRLSQLKTELLRASYKPK